MDSEALRSFFMWCTIIDGALLMFSFLMFVFAGNWVYRLHSRWYPMPRDVFNVVIYSFMGMFKLFVLVFNLVPYIALSIMA